MKVLIKAILVGIGSLSLCLMRVSVVRAQQCSAGQYCPATIQHPNYGGECRYVSGVCAAGYAGISTSSCGGTPCTFENVYRSCGSPLPTDPPSCDPGTLTWPREDCCVDAGAPTPTSTGNRNLTAANMQFWAWYDENNNGSYEDSPGYSERIGSWCNSHDGNPIDISCDDSTYFNFRPYNAGRVTVVGDTRSMSQRCWDLLDKQDCPDDCRTIGNPPRRICESVDWTEHSNMGPHNETYNHNQDGIHKDDTYQVIINLDSGWRLIRVDDGGRCSSWTRNGQDWTSWCSTWSAGNLFHVRIEPEPAGPPTCSINGTVTSLQRGGSDNNYLVTATGANNRWAYSAPFSPYNAGGSWTQLATGTNDLNNITFTCPNDVTQLGNYYLTCNADNTAGFRCTGNPWCEWDPDGYPASVPDPLACQSMVPSWTDCDDTAPYTDQMEITCNCSSWQDMVIDKNDDGVTDGDECDSTAEWSGSNPNLRSVDCRTIDSDVHLRFPNLTTTLINGLPVTEIKVKDTPVANLCDNETDWSAGVAIDVPIGSAGDFDYDLDGNGMTDTARAYKVCARLANTSGSIVRCGAMMEVLPSISGNVYRRTSNSNSCDRDILTLPADTAYASGVALRETYTGNTVTSNALGYYIIEGIPPNSIGPRIVQMPAVPAGYEILSSCFAGGSQPAPNAFTSPASPPSIFTTSVTGADWILRVLQSAWWQTEGGDVGANGAGNFLKVQSSMPANSLLSLENTVAPLPLMDSGALLYNQGTLDFGMGPNSFFASPNWMAESQYDISDPRRVENYAYFDSLFPDKTDWDSGWPGGVGDARKPPDNDPVNVYYVPVDPINNLNQDLQDNNQDWTVANGEKYVIFVPGNLTIANDNQNPSITVDTGGFLAFIVGGNITIGREVQTVQGIFIADGTITTETDDDDPQFIGQGSFIGWGGVNLGRDLGDPVANEADPAELFIYRPDFLLNAPGQFRKPRYEWSEVAP